MKKVSIDIVILLCFLCVAMGYAWRVHQETKLPKYTAGEIQIALEEGIRDKRPFWIKDTNIKIIPRSDGSGIILIKQGGKDENIHRQDK